MLKTNELNEKKSNNSRLKSEIGRKKRCLLYKLAYLNIIIIIIFSPFMFLWTKISVKFYFIFLISFNFRNYLNATITRLIYSSIAMCRFYV